MRPAVAAMQVAARGEMVRAKTALDPLLRRDPGKAEELADLAATRTGPGRRRITRLLQVGDGRIESPGESWLHLILLDLGYAPEVHATVRDGGQFVARVDFLIGRTVVEFDGAIKYIDGAAWVAEKRREHRLRSLGCRVVRVMWEDLRDAARVAALMRAAA